MSLFSDLIADGKIRDREALRRVYRRMVKRLHPDTALAAGGRERGFVDFDRLRLELGEAERLLEELAGSPVPPPVPPSPSPTSSPPPPPKPGRRVHPASSAVTASFDRVTLVDELRDLVARGLPVNARAASRNKAYRDCVAKVSVQLALLTGDGERFAKIDGQMMKIKYGSLRLHYYVSQVFWNGLDWAIHGYDWARDTALRDFGVVRQNLLELGMGELEALLAWIIEAERPLSGRARAGTSRR